MSDVHSIGSGGGSRVSVLENGRVTVGPDSVGHHVRALPLSKPQTNNAAMIIVADQRRPRFWRLAADGYGYHRSCRCECECGCRWRDYRRPITLTNQRIKRKYIEERLFYDTLYTLDGSICRGLKRWWGPARQASKFGTSWALPDCQDHDGKFSPP
ncbi:hypothetical protein BDZ97DRAFT_822238 [Flammula alnicola]|nr:hypothetical protein BDZ97DRAFT_822238 [Flammula alnicola]